MAKYLPYFGLALLAEKAVTEHGNDTVKYLFNDMSSWSPLTSVIPNPGAQSGRGGILHNPMIDTAGKVGGAIVNSFPSVKDGKYKEANPGALGRTLLTDVAPTYLPLISPVLNEIDRYNKVVHGKKYTSEVADKLGWKQNK